MTGPAESAMAMSMTGAGVPSWALAGNDRRPASNAKRTAMRMVFSISTIRWCYWSVITLSLGGCDWKDTGSGGPFVPEALDRLQAVLIGFRHKPPDEKRRQHAHRAVNP